MMSTRVITGSEIPQGLSDVLESAVGYSALLTGFSTIEYAALRSLSGLILSFMEDIAIKSLSYAESSGRVRIIPLDLALAFADSGISISSLINLPKRRQYRGFKEPLAIADSAKLGVVQTSLLGPTGAIIIPRPLGIRNQVSTSQTPGPVWIASSTSIASTPSSHLPPSPSYLRLPPAPEPHTFLATRVTRPPPAPDIATLRRRAAEQLKQVQFSLIRFLARVNPVYHLFPDDAESFPIILPKPSARPYLSALLTDAEPELKEAKSSYKFEVECSPSSIILNQGSQSTANVSSLIATTTSIGTGVSLTRPCKTPSKRPSNRSHFGGLANVENMYLKKPKFPSAEFDAHLA